MLGKAVVLKDVLVVLMLSCCSPICRFILGIGPQQCLRRLLVSLLCRSAFLASVQVNVPMDMVFPLRSSPPLKGGPRDPVDVYALDD